MSELALNRLTGAAEGLIDALDRGDAQAVEEATRQFSDAIDAVRAIGGWHATPTIVEKLQHAMKLADTARARVNYLADINRRRFEMLCKAAGLDAPSNAYDRRGRVRA